MWASALLGKPGDHTDLISPKVQFLNQVLPLRFPAPNNQAQMDYMIKLQIMEDDSICFNFWFEMTHNSGIEKLAIHMEGQRDLTRIKVWEFQQKHLDFWEEGRVQLQKLAHEDYKIVIEAKRGDLQSGYVALDDFHFETSEQEEFCSIKPPVRCCTEPLKTSPYTANRSQCLINNFPTGCCPINNSLTNDNSKSEPSDRGTFAQLHLRRLPRERNLRVGIFF